MSIATAKRWGFVATPAVLAGLIWLSQLHGASLWAWICGGPAAILMVISGGGWLVVPGERRFLRFMSLAGLFGIIGSILGVLSWGFLVTVGLLFMSVAVAALSGWIAVDNHDAPSDLPQPKLTPVLALRAALDNIIVGVFVSVPKIIQGESEIKRVAEELDAALSVYDKNGWHDNPEALVEAPPPLESPEIRRRRLQGHDVEMLRFDSGYQPHPELPGGERWLSYTSNRDARAMVFRHDDDKPRPWLICIHGYQMGVPFLDLNLFEPKFLHEKLGCNLILPLLPLHGGRKLRMISGDGYLNGDAMDTFNAVRQSQWDIRRLVSWARSQGAEKIGALGYSLGGYNTALLSTLEELDLAIPVIPLTDIPDIFWFHGPRQILDATTDCGVSIDRVKQLMKPLSPLARDSKVDLDNRQIIAGLADEVIPPGHVQQLEDVWQTGRVSWFQGSHLVFKDIPSINRQIAELVSTKLAN
jgi:hypothetical protein